MKCKDENHKKKEVRKMGFVMEEFPIPGVGPFVCL